MQASLPVLFPVCPSAFPRAVQMGTVMAAFVGLLRLGDRGRGVTFRVPALEGFPMTFVGRVARIQRYPSAVGILTAGNTAYGTGTSTIVALSTGVSLTPSASLHGFDLKRMVTGNCRRQTGIS